MPPPEPSDNSTASSPQDAVTPGASVTDEEHKSDNASLPDPFDLTAADDAYPEDHTEQEVRNGLQVTSTEEVWVEQTASGSQEFGVLINGELVSEEWIYSTQTGQVIANDGQITSTGDVDVVQNATGHQEVTSLPLQYYDGMPGASGQRMPGTVIADPSTGLLYSRWTIVVLISVRVARRRAVKEISVNENATQSIGYACWRDDQPRWIHRESAREWHPTDQGVSLP